MKDKEEFIRTDPDAAHKVYWLAVLNWIVPILCILAGLVLTTQKFAVLMNHDYDVIGRPLFILNGAYRVYNPLIFILGMFKYAFDDVYSYYFFQAAPAAFIGLVVAVLLFLITSIIVSAHQRNQHIHGTARWATRKDLEKFGMLQPRGVICGQLSSANVGYHTDKEKMSLVLNLPKNLVTRKVHVAPVVCHSGRTNTWMIAPTRTGKGVSTVIPTCLSYGVPYWGTDSKTGKKAVKGRGSMVIFDPKGENWEASAGYRSRFSTCIPFRPLDPDGDTAHYNPIHEIPDSPSEAFSWADMIAEIFFGAENAKATSDGATQYFNNTARDIFAGVVMHVRFCRYIAWKDKNLSTVLDIFSQASSDDNKGDDEESGGPGSAMLAQMREEGVHVDDSGHESPLIHELIVKAANRSETQTPKERASTYSTVFSKISLFQDPLLKNATAYSDFSVDDFIDGKNGISLYLIVPYNHIKRISPVFRMIITFMIKKFSSGTTNANAVKLKIPCLFLLDEFPVLGYFPDIALNAGILAGYGVTFFIVSQSLNQIVDVYGENHPFLDHCKTIILFAPGNIKDARQFSETIGNRSVLLDNISSSGTKWQVGFSNISRSSQETQTSLVNPDELMKMDFSRCIVFNGQMPPYKGKKVVYYEDPRFKDKAFRKVPEMNEISARLKKLPSHKRKHLNVENSIQRTIERIEKVEVTQSIPGDFDIFADDERETKF
ncbi:type IV secretory system conjugative DNA transfer family protein [uncultured Treponema sp.]|uniref:type IV secretory system conjugative DNA transfer family protein n=1 Tax=uncultured Treponema sp. TaxID=162155 RepID=UPI00261FA5BE|nr:type IV secretory system conjugative DNA transfer family protein [uncultured Treponema sp.]